MRAWRIALRRRRFCGRQIARETGVSPATVSRILRAVCLSRARDLDPPAPVVRDERRHGLGRWLGVCPRLHRRRLAHRLQPGVSR